MFIRVEDNVSKQNERGKDMSHRKWSNARPHHLRRSDEAADDPCLPTIGYKTLGALLLTHSGKVRWHEPCKLFSYAPRFPDSLSIMAVAAASGRAWKGHEKLAPGQQPLARGGI